LKNKGHSLKNEDNLNNKAIRFQLYNNFVEQEYGYLRAILNKTRLPRIPLPWCVEQGLKHEFPNEDDEAFIGFRP